MRSALLITGSIKRVWALRHQTGAQYFAVEYTRARVAVRRTETLAPQVVPASHLISETLVLIFLRSDFKCRLYVRYLSSVILRYLGVLENGSGLPFNSTESSSFASLLVRWNTDDTVFVSLSFNLHFWRYVCRVAMSWLRVFSKVRQSPAICTSARSSAYANFLEVVGGKSLT